MGYLDKTGLTYLWGKVKSYVNTRLAALDTVPQGIIAIWSGAANAIPQGWALCNGQNGTPDLRNRFVLGAGSSYSPGYTGGEESHTLTVSELPAHNHRIQGSYADMMSQTDYRYTQIHMPSPANYNWYAYADSDNTGSGYAHNNMPPYYALCYIMKL